MNMNDMYYCYSNKMKDFFFQKGFTYIGTDIHRKTEKRYWVYKRGIILDLLMDEYKSLYK